VEDTGQGIPVEILEHVFEPFFTTKEVGKGTGLGLAVVYGTVKHHGGEITVDSTQGRGTVFRIDLPLARAGERMAAEEEDGTPVPGSGQVLVVDDEPDVAQMAADILGSLGYTVTVRTNPSEAIQHFKANAEAIDLVILDMMMPGMSGRDVFMAMQAVDPELRALVTSGYSMRGLVKETLQSGALGYIKKPFDVGAFSRKVAEVMTEASSAERQPA
jgi:CheY-like chemotaxis protein